MTEITLTYFPLYGRAETTRQMLRSKGVDFTDNVVTFEQWPAEKVSGRFEFRQMPMLEIDGHSLVTSQAIERYVAVKYGLYPEDAYQAYLVESIIELKNEQVNKFVVIKFKLKDEEAMRKWASTTFLKNLKLVEARLVTNGGGHGFFVGDSATWADFSIFQFLHDGFYLPSNEQYKQEFEAATPILKAFVDRFLANDARLAEWIARRPAYSAVSG
jgi:glutathione S-transferase